MSVHIGKLKRLPRRKLLLWLVLTLSYLSLPACASLDATSSTGVKARCAAWRSITYSSSKDTPETVKQVRVHNRVGQNLKCWR